VLQLPDDARGPRVQFGPLPTAAPVPPVAGAPDQPGAPTGPPNGGAATGERTVQTSQPPGSVAPSAPAGAHSQSWQSPAQLGTAQLGPAQPEPAPEARPEAQVVPPGEAAWPGGWEPAHDTARPAPVEPEPEPEPATWPAAPAPSAPGAADSDDADVPPWAGGLVSPSWTGGSGWQTTDVNR